jgi:uncharacterized iron-regulated membrane protein
MTVRTIHRWISSVCMLLLVWVAITGTLLALDELFVPAALPDSRPAAGADASSAAAAVSAAIITAKPDADYLAMRVRTHNLLKQLHTGSIVGLSGQTLDLLTGLAFITLAITGIVMYLDLLRARRKSGRKPLFWS